MAEAVDWCRQFEQMRLIRLNPVADRLHCASSRALHRHDNRIASIRAATMRLHANCKCRESQWPLGVHPVEPRDLHKKTWEDAAK